MLIIFGFRINFRTIGTIEFFCPRCGGDRQGDRRTARRWFTIFWIPVIPLNHVGEVLECTTCHTRFEPAVADQPTTAGLQLILGNAVRVLTAMIVGAGDCDSAAMRAAAVAEVQAVDADYDDATLGSDLGAVDPALAAQYVVPLAEGIQVAGKERLLSNLVRVALASGTVTPDQRSVIDLTGRGLGLTSAHITGIVSSVAAARSPEPLPPPDPRSGETT